VVARFDRSHNTSYWSCLVFNLPRADGIDRTTTYNTLLFISVVGSPQQLTSLSQVQLWIFLGHQFVFFLSFVLWPCTLNNLLLRNNICSIAAHCVYKLHGVRIKSLGQNFNKFRHSFVIFDMNHPDNTMHWKSENLAQNCNSCTWRWRTIWRHQKCRFHTKTHLTKGLQK